MRPLAALVLCLSVCLGAGGPSFAQSLPADEAARRHHARGTTYYNLGQFEEAIAEYRKGYEQKADPVFLYNIGQSYRQLGANEKALFFYRRYLSTAPEASNRAHVQERITELEGLVTAEARSRNAPPPAPLSAFDTAARADASRTRADLVTAPAAPSVPLVHRWWFWAGVGAIVATGVAVALVASSGGNPPPSTDLGTMVFF